jgi:acyl-CoA thioesterase-1
MFYKTLITRIANSIAVLLLTAMTLLLFQPQALADERAKILVLGDSLSAGRGMDISASWTTLLQLKLDELGYGYKVVNASISGDTTSSGLKRLPRALQVHQPEIVIIELGGNDGLRATPVPVVRDNLLQLVETSKNAGAAVIVAGIQIPPNYGAGYTDEFTALFFDIAAETQSSLIPFFMKDVALDPAMMQMDNIHPNEKGQPVLLNNTWDILEPLLEQASGDQPAS